MNVLLSLFGYRHHTYLVIIVKRKQSFEKEKSCRGNLTQILVLTTVWVYLPALARPRSPLVEGDEGLHLSNFQQVWFMYFIRCLYCFGLS